MPPTEASNRPVLVIFSGALGDLICLLPALRELERRYRDCSVELMARPELADFAVGRMGIARGHSIDRREVSLLFSPADDAAQQAAQFFGGFGAIHSFFGMDNPRVREILTSACPGRAFFHPFRPQVEGHVSMGYLQSVEEGCGAAGRIRGESARLELLDRDLDQARRMLSHFGAASRQYLMLLPGSGSKAKNWPAENYLQLARHLTGCTTVLTVLGPAEADLAGVFSSHGVISHPPLAVLAAVARMSAGFVGNDSGVSHLAAAVGARGVVIFGPTDPMRWRPLGAVTVLRRVPLGDLTWYEVARALEQIKWRADQRD
jgi:ADP-heptose:LPS heptosyltransferase